MASSRRKFLRQSCGALGAALFASGMNRFGLVSALAQSATADYKALVCIFLFGGNDGNNTVVPLETTEYTAYSNVRGGAGLAIAQDQLLPITPSSINRQFGLHPKLTELHKLWAQQKLAVLSNVGPLVQPLTKAQFQSGIGHPYQMFSHPSQVDQWQTSFADRPAQSGWGGRIADSAAGFNGSAPLPMVVSMAGMSAFTLGRNLPLEIAPAPVALSGALALDLTGSATDTAARRAAVQQLLQMGSDAKLVRSASDITAQALVASQALGTDPKLTTKFPNTPLASQLKQVAKLISLRTALGLKRQIFFCVLGGFDTHNNQPGPQGDLLAQVGSAMKSFYDASVELGVSDQVTTFTLSDFGRTLEPSGSGSDHAWGNHHFIMGGAVRGGDFYGTAGPNGTVFPTLSLSGPDDMDGRGRWIPTTSVDQYAATLARWFGLSDADISTVFPYIGRFPTADLGFLV